MWDLKKEVVNTAKLTGIPIVELSETTLASIKLKTQIKFDIEDRFTNWDPNAWRWISEHVEDEKIILFFKIENEKVGFEITNGSQVVTILGESHHFDFYITNWQNDYLIFYEARYLMGWGTAKGWLKKRTMENKKQEFEDN